MDATTGTSSDGPAHEGAADVDTLSRLAQWFERRIDATMGFDTGPARLYGLLLNDPAGLARDDPGAARASFVGDDADIQRLLSGAFAVIARSFDAAVVVTCGWAAPIEPPDTPVRPSEHPGRRRIRVVAAVSDAGVRSVSRFEDARRAPVVYAERGAGNVVDALEALWFGDPFASVALPADAGPATARVCRRRT